MWMTLLQATEPNDDDIITGGEILFVLIIILIAVAIIALWPRNRG
jgi:hypothetical protein